VKTVARKTSSIHNLRRSSLHRQTYRRIWEVSSAELNLLQKFPDVEVDWKRTNSKDLKESKLRGIAEGLELIGLFKFGQYPMMELGSKTSHSLNAGLRIHLVILSLQLFEG